MYFEIKDGKDRLPDEDDVYAVNDVEERDAFNSLFGLKSIEKRHRNRRLLMAFLSAIVLAAFLLLLFSVSFR